ncbi:hypothetical protein FHS43_006370 [Streptosporangium becharense]|uniref:Uncharacterized protein n=1 Tax=Streptosporangium becharense TaxID=1816182 RepID=A0A7W9ICC9_9ACTN|nr:hypothetical protein [Streptosporangium becharense]MBB2915055.1 hypothetical protein [Streptosporangium becharense]MBB5818104.1 hypothetical protein [Streptosporangium becharense]
MKGPVATRLRIPYVIAHAGEAVPQRLRFVRRPLGGLRLAYDDPRRGDEAYGVLRVRVRGTRQGAPQWRMLNTLRQWRCMERHLCQVCGEPATDPASGRIPWIMTDTAFRELPDDPTGGLTSAPPTCEACIPEALATCPQLHISSAVCTAARSEPAAVLADMFTPGPNGRAVHTGEHNVEISLKDETLLPYALATQLVVQVHDLRPAPHPVG